MKTTNESTHSWRTFTRSFLQQKVYCQARLAASKSGSNMSILRKTSRSSSGPEEANDTRRKDVDCKPLTELEDAQHHHKNSHVNGNDEAREGENNGVRLKNSSRDDEMKPPDGGWGWLVAIGDFLIMVSFSKMALYRNSPLTIYRSHFRTVGFSHRDQSKLKFFY